MQTGSPQLARFAKSCCHAWGDAGEPLQPLALSIPQAAHGQGLGAVAERGAQASRASFFSSFFPFRRACPALQLSHHMCSCVRKSLLSQRLCQREVISIPGDPHPFGSSLGAAIPTCLSSSWDKSHHSLLRGRGREEKGRALLSMWPKLQVCRCSQERAVGVQEHPLSRGQWPCSAWCC